MFPSPAAAMTAIKPAGRVNLSGTSGTPQVDTGLDEFPTVVQAGWEWKTDGSLNRIFNGAWNPTPDEWFDPNGSPNITYYIRYTFNSGTAADVINPSVGIWAALTTERNLLWEQSGVGSTGLGSYKVEIARDSGGTNIIATGYYGGECTVDPSG